MSLKSSLKVFMLVTKKYDNDDDNDHMSLISESGLFVHKVQHTNKENEKDVCFSTSLRLSKLVNR